MKRNTAGKKSFLKNPSFKDVLWMCAAWFTGTLLVISSSTNLFQEPLTPSNMDGFGILLLSSTTVIVIMLRNYFRHRKAVKNETAKSH